MIKNIITNLINIEHNTREDSFQSTILSCTFLVGDKHA